MLYDIISSMGYAIKFFLEIAGSLILGILLVAGAGTLALQQLGRHNRTLSERISNKGSQYERKLLRKLAQKAAKHGDDTTYEVAIEMADDSYFNSFMKDLSRGAKVLEKNIENYPEKLLEAPKNKIRIRH